MFGIGPQEMVIVGILLLIVFGPGKLPGMARDLGGFVSKARRQIDDLKEEFVSAGDDEPGLVSSGGDELSEGKTFKLEIKEGTMTPDEITVDEGDEVTLWITSDSPISVHLDGYYLSARVEPGELLDLPFEADVPGRFEIEDEATETALGMLIVEPHEEEEDL